MTGRSSPAVSHATRGNGTESVSVGPGAEPITSSRRRFALQTLGTFAYPVELRTLAAHVVAARENVPLEAVDEETRERTAVRLHHVDIPALAAAGLVEYDPESRMAVRIETHTDDRYAGTTTDSRRFDAV
ncbi:DUF7344 domain-containing protein [Halococcus agarilyticus]|uniref:DUF7344 domain-containing protein n=1 Tax=Halococcus agarilyticus TaxID=1232219 RepID=UPI0006780CE1|nr:hypothetical protein [Halococcus agarilyticus]